MYITQILSNIRRRISFTGGSVDRLALIERKLDALDCCSHGAGAIQASSMDRLAAVERKLNALEFGSHAARAVYLGNGRVLLKAVVFGANIAYILEGDDRLLAPWFIVSGQYETPLTNWLVPKLRQDSVCIDVGANFGYFTCVFSRFAHQGKVIGVEPDPTVFAVLRDNVQINGFSAQASVINAAASDSIGELTLYRRSTRSGNTSIINVSDEFTSSMGERSAEPIVARALTVDQICLDLGGRLDFLKIDVEGAEPLVFRGARDAIRNNKQLNVVFEWSPGQIQGAGFDLREFLSNLSELGLSAFSIEESGQESILTYDDLLRSPYMAGVVLRRC